MTPSIFVNKVVLEHSHAHLCITSGCPCTTMADPSSCDRDQNLYSLDFFSKRLLTPFSVPSDWARGPGIFGCCLHSLGEEPAGLQPLISVMLIGSREMFLPFLKAWLVVARSLA